MIICMNILLLIMYLFVVLQLLFLICCIIIHHLANENKINNILILLKNDKFNISDIPHHMKNEQVYMKIINKNVKIINYIPNISDNLYEHIMKNHCNDIAKLCVYDKQFLKDIDKKFLTYEMCKIIVHNNGLSLKHIPTVSKDIQLLAIKNNPFAIKYIDDQTLELCKIAINKNPFSIKYINDKNEYYCNMAINKDPNSIRGIQNLLDKIYIQACKYNPRLLSFLCSHKPELCFEIVKNDVELIVHVRKNYRTREMCEYVVKQDGMLLRFCKYKSYDICCDAVKQNKNAIQYVNKKIGNKIVRANIIKSV